VDLVGILKGNLNLEMLDIVRINSFSLCWVIRWSIVTSADIFLN